MKRKVFVIVILILSAVLITYGVVNITTKKKTYESYMHDDTSGVVVIESPNDLNEVSGDFRYESTDKCVREILLYEGSEEYTVIYVANAVDTWVYYIQCNDSIWYVVEGIDSVYCQKEEYLTYDEVLEQIAEDMSKD